MNFGEQFKRLRADRRLTQDEVAARLCVSRQAVSNWENNKNLPDLELIIEMARAFNLSLDELITGGKDMNNMTEKLIKDSSETRRATMNLISVIIGAALLCAGAGCIFIKANSVEYIDAAGVLHESFFLLPIGFFLLLCGVITFLSIGVRGVVTRYRQKRAARQQ